MITRGEEGGEKIRGADGNHAVERSAAHMGVWAAGGAPQFDLVFVDGGHGYDIVRGDVVASLRLLRPGGLVVCDDVQHKGVRRAIAELMVKIADDAPAEEVAAARLIFCYGLYGL